MMVENINDFTLEELNEISINMQSSASNLYQLLENLLEWSRIQRDLTEFTPDKCLLSFIINQNIELSDEISKQKNIKLFNKVPNEMMITADIQMLNSVIRNLISNAIKFTPRGGIIEIGITDKKSPVNKQSSDNYLIIYIKDSGIGMNKDIISKLFKIEHKVFREGTEGEASTGLGLLLCKDFIEKHGGNIWVESEEGKGSTFYFTLPV